MYGQQSEIDMAADVLSGDVLDKALHECMVAIWQGYRAGVSDFNNTFAPLYKKYTDPAVVRFIECMGIGLAAAVNRKGGHGGHGGT